MSLGLSVKQRIELKLIKNIINRLISEKNNGKVNFFFHFIKIEYRTLSSVNNFCSIILLIKGVFTSKVLESASEENQKNCLPLASKYHMHYQYGIPDIIDMVSLNNFGILIIRYLKISKVSNFVITN